MSEVIRSGIQAVDKGQDGSGEVTGMSDYGYEILLSFRRLLHLYSCGWNEFVTLIKETSVLSYSGDARFCVRVHCLVQHLKRFSMAIGVALLIRY